MSKNKIILLAAVGFAFWYLYNYTNVLNTSGTALG